MTRPSIFISYRRRDTGYLARAVYESLQDWLDRDELFLDLVRLLPGCEFERELDSAIDGCIGLIALVGPDWLEGIGDPKDWVRREIHMALTRSKPILPVFGGGVSPPSASSTPTEIQPAILQKRCVHLSPHSARLELQPIADWANGIPHHLAFADARFRRTAVPAGADRQAEAFYLSEDLLPAGEWATRLQRHLPSLAFDCERRSTSAAATELVLGIDRSLKIEKIRDARLDLPFLDELERAAIAERSLPRPGFSSGVVHEVPQLCRSRASGEFATIGIAAEGAWEAGALITRYTGLAELPRPFRLALRRPAVEGATDGE